MQTREYFVIGAIGILCVFSFAVGLEKMLRIILGNYLLTALCLALGPTLDRLSVRILGQDPSIQDTVGFIFTNKTIAILIIYFLMLILIFAKSRINISVQVGGIKKILFFVLAIPMTIFSILFTLEIAILGTAVFNVPTLSVIAGTMPIPVAYQQFMINTPLFISIHALLTIFLLSNIKFPSFRRSVRLPDVEIDD